MNKENWFRHLPAGLAASGIPFHEPPTGQAGRVRSGFREFRGQTQTAELLAAAFQEGADAFDWGQDLRERLLKETNLSDDPEARGVMLNIIERRVFLEAPDRVVVRDLPEAAFEIYGDTFDVLESSGFGHALQAARDAGYQAQSTLQRVAGQRGGRVGVGRHRPEANAWTHVGPFWRGAWLILSWSIRDPSSYPMLHVGWIAHVSPKTMKEAA